MLVIKDLSKIYKPKKGVPVTAQFDYSDFDAVRLNEIVEINGVPTDEDRIPLNALTNPKNKIIASYGADGLVQAKFEIVSFQVKLPTGVSLKVNGDRFDKKAMDAIKKLKQGNTINLMYIKAKGPDGQEIQLRGLPIELR